MREPSRPLFDVPVETCGMKIAAKFCAQHNFATYGTSAGSNRVRVPKGVRHVELGRHL